MAEPDFHELLVESERLVSRLGAETGIKPVHKDVMDLESASRALFQSTPAAAPRQDLNASAIRLLAERNFNAEELTRNVRHLELQAQFEPMEPLGQTDIAAYLQHHHEMLIITAIEETKLAAERDANLAQEQWILDDWLAQREDTMNRTLGPRTMPALPPPMTHAHPPTLSSFLTSTPSQIRDAPRGMPDGSLGSPIFGSEPRSRRRDGGEGGSAMRSGEARVLSAPTQSNVDHYAQKLAEVVRSLSAKPPRTELRPATQMRAIEAERLRRGEGGAGQELLVHLWELLRLMFAEDGVRRGEGEEARIQGAMAFLEAQYVALVDRQTSAPPSTPLLGRIATYVSSQEASPSFPPPSLRGPRVGVERSGGATVLLWPLVYVCLRCGASEEAQKVLAMAEAQGVEEDVGVVARAMTGGRKAEAETMYRTSTAKGEEADCPFRRMVLNLVSGAEPTRGPKSVIKAIECYIWAGLFMVQIAKSPTSLEALAARVRGFGPAHFDPQGRSPLKYALILLQVQDFAGAVVYLAEKHRTSEATHLAILFDAHELLGQEEQVPLPHLVQLYTQRMVVTDAEVALAYILRLPTGETQMTQLVRLVRSNRQGFDALLGAVGIDDHRRMEGALDEFFSDADVKRVAFVAGQAALQQGSAADAIELFARAEAFHLVADVLCERLSAVLSPPNTPPASDCDFWRSAGVAFLRKGIRLPSRSSSEQTLKALLTMHSFFELYSSDDCQRALTTVQPLNLFPTKETEVAECMEQYQHLPLLLKAHLADLLVGVMECYQRLHHKHKSQQRTMSGGDPMSQTRADYRKRGNVLVTFAGLITLGEESHAGFALSASHSELAARLGRLEVMMM